MLKYKQIFVGSTCENNCLSCRFRDTRRELREPSEIHEELVAAAAEGQDNLELIGGNPLLRPDLGGLVAEARDAGFSHIKIRTNGRILSDWEAMSQLLGLGVLLFEIKVFGPTPEIHDRITRSGGSFQQTLAAIRNLKRAGPIGPEAVAPFVAVRVPVSQDNHPYLDDITRAVVSLKVDRVILSLDDPGLPVSRAAVALQAAIQTAVFHRVWPFVEGAPLCVMKDFEHHVAEAYGLGAAGGKKVKGCVGCVYDRVCDGPAAPRGKRQAAAGFRAVGESSHAGDLLRLRFPEEFEEAKEVEGAEAAAGGRTAKIRGAGKGDRK